MAPALPAAPQELDAISDDSLWSTKAEFCDVPVVDLEGVDGERRQLVLQQIRQVCEDWGIFQVVNHGMPGSLLTSMLQLAQGFFELPVEEKRKLSTRLDNPNTPQHGLVQGYSSKDYGRSFLDWGDQLRHITSPASARNYELWPADPPSYRETEEEFIAGQDKFGKLMLELISESLGLSKSAVSDYFEESFQKDLVANHYPPCPDPGVTVGLVEHSDCSLLSVLFQDSLGLQVLAKDGGWGYVKPIRDALVVNLGDQMQILSNGKYQSPVHRATVNSARRRVSIVAFTLPTDHTVVAPMSAMVSAAQPALYPGLTFGAYRAAFAAQPQKDKKILLKDTTLTPAAV